MWHRIHRMLECRRSTRPDPSTWRSARPSAIAIIVVLLSLVGVTGKGQDISVEEFTGTLSASVPVVMVPGPGGSGYAISLQYGSDVRPEDEASIVGYGWNMTVPAITRTKRGYPDDYREARFDYRNPSYMDNVTWSVAGVRSFEAFANDAAGISASTTISHNTFAGWDVTTSYSLSGRLFNINGFGLGTSLGVDTKGNASVGLSVSLSTALVSNAPPPVSLQLGCGFNLTNVWRTRDPFGGAFVPVTGTMVNVEGVLLAGTLPGGVQGGVNVSRSVVRTIDRSTGMVSGYLYGAEKAIDPAYTGVLDYSVEKFHAFADKRARNLGMPVPDYDLFSVSVPGISGSFRLHHRLPLQVRPMVASSRIDLHTIRGEVITSAGAGVGIPLPLTGYSTSGSEYDAGGSTAAMAEDIASNAMRPWMWRYVGDMSGDVRYARDTSVIWPDLDKGMRPSTYHPINRDHWPGSTRHIVHHTYGALRTLIATNGPRAAFLANRIDAIDVGGDAVNMEARDSTIAEFIVTGGDGRTYWFSDPVYATKEVSMAYTLARDVARQRQLVANRRLVYSGDGSDGVDIDRYSEPENRYQSGNGSESIIPYAVTFLLSAILEPDYVDLTGDGPTPDDLGGYTVFDYTTMYHDFRTRSPYRGFWYDTGSLTSMDDDRISSSFVVGGVKVLSGIRTKSHRSAFTYGGHTAGTGARTDAVEAAEERTAGQRTARGTRHMPYLQKVSLYRLGIGTEDETLLSTRHFVYDYSLVPDCPSCAPGSGRLTLKRTWTEERDVKEARILPTDFRYTYPAVATTSAPNTINTLGMESWQASSIPQPTGGLDENPTYDSERIDGWGFYRKAQSTAFSRTYDHTPDQTTGDIDPAAYRLKQVVSPTGAVTVIGYEPHRYETVQDKPVTMMVPLTMSSTETSTSGWPSRYCANLGAIAPVTSDERSAVIAALQAEYQTRNRRLYHRLAYDFMITLVPNVTLPGYVRGYSHVGNVAGSATPSVIDVALKGNGTSPGGSATLSVARLFHGDEPKILAIDMLYDGVLRRRASSMPSGVLDAAQRLLSELVSNQFPLGSLLIGSAVNRTTLLPEQSFLRVPWPRAKLGGGVRVATVVTVSPSGTLEAGDAAIVGQHYEYHDGVATNEPPQMREQNALVDLLPDDVADDEGRACGETDIAEAEGPYGETLMPSASVGYGRVNIVGIHGRNGGSTAPGYVAMAFHTARTSPPVRMQKTSLRTRIKEPLWFLGISEYEEYHVRASQGYSFVIADMHGLPKATEQMTGVPDGVATVVSGTYYDYNDPVQPVYIFDTLGVPLSMEHRGRMQDIIYEVKKYREAMDAGWIDVNLSFVPFSAGIGPAFRHSDKSIVTMVTTKITTVIPTLRAVRSMVDGVVDSTVIVAYDKVTGETAVTAQYDGYHGAAQPEGTHNGATVTITVPACRRYPQLGMKSTSEGRRFISNATTFNNPPYGKFSVVGYSGTNPLKRNVDLVFATEGGSTAWHTKDRLRRADAVHALLSLGDMLDLYDVNGGYVGTMRLDSLARLFGYYVELYGPCPVPVNTVKQVRIRTSVRQNQPDLPGASLVLYDVDVDALRADGRTWYARQQIADRLNDYVRTGTDGHYNDLRWEHLLAINPDVYAGTPIDPIPYSASQETYAGTCPDGGGRYSWRVVRSGSNVHIGWWHKDCLYSFPTCYCANGWFLLSGGTPSTMFAFMDRHYSPWRLFGVGIDGRLGYSSVPSALGIAPPVSAPGDQLLFDIRNNVAVTTPTVDQVHQPVTLGTGLPVAPAAALASSVVVYDRSSIAGAPTSRLRPKTTYTYVAESVVAAQPGPGAKNYLSAGTFPMTEAWPTSHDTSLLAFTSGGGWMRGSIITYYDLHGNPVEVRDGIDVPSYTEVTDGGRRTRAAVMAANARQVWSEDFETIDAVTTTTAARHTGRRAASIPLSTPITPPAPLMAHPADRPYVLSFWMYRSQALVVDTAGAVTVNWGDGTAVVTDNDVLASIDGWQLVELLLPDGDVVTSLQFSSTIPYTVLVDDILVRPFESVARRIVVDNTGELRASLDDRGFAVLPQYDDRGRAHRVVGEFLTGRHLVTDSRMHVPGRMRPPSQPAGGAYASVGETSAPPILLSRPAMPDVLRRPLPEGMLPDGLLQRPQGLDGAVDVLETTLRPDGGTVKVLGTDIPLHDAESVPPANPKDKP